jgi:hypothetical protein
MTAPDRWGAYTIRPPDADTIMWTAHRGGMPVATRPDEASLLADLESRREHGPDLPARADLDAATAATAAAIANPAASLADVEYAAEMEQATLEPAAAPWKVTLRAGLPLTSKDPEVRTDE